ncbi:Uncharacterised protein [Serratia liquefaciens]|jgi:hypothetical protein|nr:Uncharacterised protein [Serratia liquefaciens]CAI0870899.1 Uncharacterised protein [Serratia liquefaciens]
MWSVTIALKKKTTPRIHGAVFMILSLALKDDSEYPCELITIEGF